MERINKYLYVIIAIAVVFIAIGTQRTGASVNWPAVGQMLLQCGSAAGIVSAVIWAFDRWLWTWPILNCIFLQPRLYGTWHARLRFFDDGKLQSEAQGYLVVRQTYLYCSMRLLTETSQSRLRIGELVDHPDGTYSFGCIYQATPHAQVRWTNRTSFQIHRGAMLLSVQTAAGNWWSRLRTGLVADRLVGEFWTDCGDLGTIDITDCRPIQVESYESAHAVFQD